MSQTDHCQTHQLPTPSAIERRIAAMRQQQRHRIALSLQALHSQGFSFDLTRYLCDGGEGWRCTCWGPDGRYLFDEMRTDQADCLAHVVMKSLEHLS